MAQWFCHKFLHFPLLTFPHSISNLLFSISFCPVFVSEMFIFPFSPFWFNLFAPIQNLPHWLCQAFTLPFIRFLLCIFFHIQICFGLLLWCDKTTTVMSRDRWRNSLQTGNCYFAYSVRYSLQFDVSYPQHKFLFQFSVNVRQHAYERLICQLLFKKKKNQYFLMKPAFCRSYHYVEVIKFSFRHHAKLIELILIYKIRQNFDDFIRSCNFFICIPFRKYWGFWKLIYHLWSEVSIEIIWIESCMKFHTYYSIFTVVREDSWNFE